MNPARADRTRSWIRQMFPQHARKELQRSFGLSDKEARKVVLGEASDETIGRLASRLGDEFILFVHGRRPLPAMAPTRFHWIGDTEIYPAEDGLANFMRRRFGESGEPDQDHIHYALANLGWVAVAQHSARVDLRFGESVDENALRLARDWLGRESPASVAINGQSYPDHIAAMIALEDQVGSTKAREAMLVSGWKVIRQPLDAVQSKPLTKFIRACHVAGNAPGTLPKILTDLRLLPTAALLRVKGGSVVSLWAGPRLGVAPETVIGKDLRDRPGDGRYPEMVRAHILRACREPDGLYHELRDIEIDGRRHNYRRVAFAERPGADGGRLVATVVERLAA